MEKLGAIHSHELRSKNCYVQGEYILNLNSEDFIDFLSKKPLIYNNIDEQHIIQFIGLSVVSSISSTIFVMPYRLVISISMILE